MFLALILTAFSAFAQDGYHAEPAPLTCPDSSCLLVGENGYGFYTMEDLEGMTHMSLNTRSNLSDIFPDQSVCFAGPKACDIVHALAGNNDRDYMMGSHTRIQGLKCETTELGLSVRYYEVSDYSSLRDLQEFTISQCL